VKSSRLRLSLVFLPLGLGLVGAFLFNQNLLPNFIFTGTYQFDLVPLASVSGALLSLSVGSWLWIADRVRLARAEERQIQAEANRSFWRSLDHELKNPLMIIRLGAINLQQEAGLTQEQTASLDRIVQQVQRLQKLVEDLRWLTKLEEHALEKSLVHLPEILEEARVLVTGMPEYRGRTVTLRVREVPWPVSPIQGDPALLIQTFRNLLENALKFSDSQGQVEIQIRDDKHVAIVEIADNGRGIPPEDIEHITQVLYRSSNARDKPGSGIGLSLAQQIIALHGGELSVSSRIGQGTLVTVRLPLAPPEK